jgi:hypothetical protein
MDNQDISVETYASLSKHALMSSSEQPRYHERADCTWKAGYNDSACVEVRLESLHSGDAVDFRPAVGKPRHQTQLKSPLLHLPHTGWREPGSPEAAPSGRPAKLSADQHNLRIQFTSSYQEC